MQVLKKDNTEENFDIMKIISVLNKANDSLAKAKQISPEIIRDVADEVLEKLTEENKKFTTSNIQSKVETVLISHNLVALAKAYIIGCYEIKLQNQMSALDKSVMDIISNTNKAVALENSNKNAMLNSTQRDYIAGEISKSLAHRTFEEIRSGKKRCYSYTRPRLFHSTNE